MFESAQALYAVLDRTVQNLQADESFAKRIAWANVSVAFCVTDLDAEYTMTFRKGEVSGAAGGADGATLSVILDTATLDAVLSGRTSGESAYYSGKLRLRGDEWVAESVAAYVAGIAPAYKAARDAGD